MDSCLRRNDKKSKVMTKRQRNDKKGEGMTRSEKE
jgi:hypothetical protein